MMKTKSAAEVRDGFEAFLTKYKHELSHDKPIRWHTDNGGEFTSENLSEFCDEYAICRSFSIPHSHGRNSTNALQQ